MLQHLASFAFAFSPAADTTIVGDANAEIGSVLAAGDFNDDGYDDLIAASGLLADTTWLYLGSAAGLSTTWSWSISSRATDTAVADVNGDGIDDLVIQQFAGAGGMKVKVFHGSSAGLPSSPDWSIRKDAVYDIASGDVNGDGLGDLLVVDARAVDSFGPRNRVYLYLGSSTGLETSTAVTFLGASGDYTYGTTVAMSDLDGDGYDEAVLGCPWKGSGGKLFVYAGSSTGPTTVKAQTILGPAGAELGETLEGGGDFDGDGYEDLVAAFWTGEHRVYYGSTTYAGTSVTDGPYGSVVTFAIADDTDGDGTQELLVGHPEEGSTGQAGVYHGTASGVVLATETVGSSNNDDAGTAVAAGDFDGDGTVDWATSAPGASGRRGEIGVFYDAP